MINDSLIGELKMIFKKIFLILFFLAALMYPGYVSSQDCKPPLGPPPDNADVNFSFNLQGVNITAFSPYLEEFLFNGIRKMSVRNNRGGKFNVA